GEPGDLIAVGDRQQGSQTGASSHPRTRTAIARDVVPSIAPGMAYSAHSADPWRVWRAVSSRRIDRASPALGVPLPAVHAAQLPGPVHAGLGGVARAPRGPRDP